MVYKKLIFNAFRKKGATCFLQVCKDSFSIDVVYFFETYVFSLDITASRSMCTKGNLVF